MPSGRTLTTASVLTAIVALVLALGCGSGPEPSAPVELVDPPPPGEDGALAQVIAEVQPLADLGDDSVRDANALRESVIAAVDERGWRSAERAAADGFVPMPLEESHWYHPDHVADDRFFDPEAPEFVVVDGDDVVGVMFLAASAGLEQPDPPGAPLVRWHYHRWSESVCLLDGLVIVGPLRSGGCGDGEVASDVSPFMAHVWLVDTEDPFATEMDAHQH